MNPDPATASSELRQRRHSHQSMAPLDGLNDLTGDICIIDEVPAGVGGFAKVWKGRWTRNVASGRVSGGTCNETLAVKILTFRLNEDDARLKLLQRRELRELKIWAPLDHKNIVPLYGVTIDTHDANNQSLQFPAMISPWRENGNLNTFLVARGFSLSRTDRTRMIGNVLVGLAYLHAKSIVHGDISGSNVLVHADGTCCLADFGLSAVLNEFQESSHITSSQNGTARWAAPELFAEGDFAPTERRSKAGDIYSFGNIMLQILSGEIPCIPADHTVVIACSLGKLQPRPAPPLVTDSDWQLLKWCWKPTPCERPTVSQVKDIFEFSGSYQGFNCSAGEQKLRVEKEMPPVI